MQNNGFISFQNETIQINFCWHWKQGDCKFSGGELSSYLTYQLVLLYKTFIKEHENDKETRIPTFQQQSGSKDCAVFVIALGIIFLFICYNTFKYIL